MLQLHIISTNSKADFVISYTYSLIVEGEKRTLIPMTNKQE